MSFVGSRQELALAIKSACIYCSASGDAPETYRKAAHDIGAALARRKIRVVFGGGRMGLMGVVADAALAEGGEVTGIIPSALREREIQHDGVTELIVVPDMHARKHMMIGLSDVFVVLPGGLGTLDEALEALTWKRLRLHQKPILIFNQDGFWDPLLALFRHLHDRGLAHPGDLELYIVVNTVDELMQAIDRLKVLS